MGRALRCNIYIADPYEDLFTLRGPDHSKPKSSHVGPRIYRWTTTLEAEIVDLRQRLDESTRQILEFTEWHAAHFWDG